MQFHIFSNFFAQWEFNRFCNIAIFRTKDELLNRNAIHASDKMLNAALCVSVSDKKRIMVQSL